MDSLKNIWKALMVLLKDNVRLFTLKGVEKSSLVLGLFATVFIVLGFCMIILVFASVALAIFLNGELGSAFLGYLIISATYLLILALLLVWVVKRKIPFLTGIFVQTLIVLFNIPEDEDNRP